MLVSVTAEMRQTLSCHMTTNQILYGDQSQWLLPLYMILSHFSNTNTRLLLEVRSFVLYGVGSIIIPQLLVGLVLVGSLGGTLQPRYFVVLPTFLPPYLMPPGSVVAYRN